MRDRVAPMDRTRDAKDKNKTKKKKKKQDFCQTTINDKNNFTRFLEYSLVISKGSYRAPRNWDIVSSKTKSKMDLMHRARRSGEKLKPYVTDIAMSLWGRYLLQQ